MQVVMVVLACGGIVAIFASKPPTTSRSASPSQPSAIRLPEGTNHELTGPNSQIKRDELGTRTEASALVAAGSSTSATPQEQVLEAIQAAAVTYDPGSLPLIDPYLYHPDPVVRAAAVDGVVILGNKAGSSILRNAASKSGNASEVAHLLEMAAYLELPPLPVDQIVAKIKAAKGSKPSNGRPREGSSPGSK